MPYETKAEIERERDDLRDALEGILDRVTDALGVEGDEDDQVEDQNEANEIDE